MVEFVSQAWPWYVSGPLITLVMFLLLWLGSEFGVSHSLRTLCAIGGAGRKIPFFHFAWREKVWDLVFVLGAILGGYLAVTFLADPEPLQLSAATVEDLAGLGVSFDGGLAPEQLFSWSSLQTGLGAFLLIGGGFLIGFGTRYAGGCTSGHSISGLSNLQLPSLVASIGFFLGGLLVTHLLFPFIF